MMIMQLIITLQLGRADTGSECRGQLRSRPQCLFGMGAMGNTRHDMNFNSAVHYNIAVYSLRR